MDDITKDLIMYPKSFVMIRDRRIVAYGTVFDDKKCVVNWLGENRSVVIWDTFDMMMKINGHFGTRIHFDKRTQVIETKLITGSEEVTK